MVLVQFNRESHVELDKDAEEPVKLLEVYLKVESTRYIFPGISRSLQIVSVVWEWPNKSGLAGLVV